ncbi:hypothetical protein [Endozoicomonas sp. SCSIO W0465]|uniref:hypothetical protein n=1 Tax=Endozoicomonas sp. SCSIO W0465 TaxID=2918516 RepID=UPI002075470E|nr:hypothetical protein [Endozoicomonas sp. SCSIO W0465]USE39533.1 hypothetical protein MJO57_16025 [Endozoicomonas sp. SCSIO W0465]
MSSFTIISADVDYTDDVHVSKLAGAYKDLKNGMSPDDVQFKHLIKYSELSFLISHLNRGSLLCYKNDDVEYWYVDKDTSSLAISAFLHGYDIDTVQEECELSICEVLYLYHFVELDRLQTFGTDDPKDYEEIENFLQSIMDAVKYISKNETMSKIYQFLMKKMKVWK